MQERWLSVQEIAAHLGVNRDTIYKWIEQQSERIYNETVGRENLCLRSGSAPRSATKAFYAFKASAFLVTVEDIGKQADFLEYLPNCIYYHPYEKSATLEIPLDLFEVLCRTRFAFPHQRRTIPERLGEA